jgi:hypothetical protein
LPAGISGRDRNQVEPWCASCSSTHQRRLGQTISRNSSIVHHHRATGSPGWLRSDFYLYKRVSGISSGQHERHIDSAGSPGSNSRLR